MGKSILIDATHFGAQEPTGVECYVDELLPRLSHELIRRGVTVYWTGHNEPADIPDNVHWVQSDYVKGWGQRGVRRLMKDGHYDLYFTPSGIVPLGGSFKRAMTVHDISFEKFRRAYSPLQWLRLHSWGKRAAHASSVLVVPAQAVQRDITHIWGIPKTHIRVIPHGIIGLPARGVVVPKVEPPYIFFLGRIETKKNLVTLIQAFALFAKEAPDLKLVLAGNPGFGHAAIVAEIRELPRTIRERICLLGYVSAAESSWLYRNAQVLAVPSPAEGFGFPVLNAFEVGLPVVTADMGAAPEVGGDAVLQANAQSPGAWAVALKEALFNGGVRRSLITAGKDRLKDFSWDKAARETAEALIEKA